MNCFVPGLRNAAGAVGEEKNHILAQQSDHSNYLKIHNGRHLGQNWHFET